MALPAAGNKDHLDTLTEGLHWTLCEYGDVSDALQTALELIAATRPA